MSGCDASGNSWSGGARVSAAFEMQRSQLEENPEAVTHTLRQNMARTLRSDPRAGQDTASSFEDSDRSRTIRISDVLPWFLWRYGTFWRCKMC